MAIVLKTNGDVVILEPRNGSGMPFSVEELQSTVKGPIEVLPYKDDGRVIGHLVHNADGRGLLPRNEDVSRSIGLAVYGDVMICSPVEMGQVN